MLDLGTVIDPKSIKTELSLLKKEAKEAKESPKQKSPSPTPSKTTSNKADKAEKAKIYNFNDDPSKENSPEPEMQGNAEEEGNENKKTQKITKKRVFSKPSGDNILGSNLCFLS